ncbi:LacI family DNA-binding transcriptional regulator [Actinomadura sp. 7K507]|uniref:LacI family DNA-binding transcriptional regulator n=1 Tax=Actinomadura sp. 7K507 TaxID=2530365 RepID=UPI0010457B52|nr:LacI family DNA-binding transcriptional regulator [Actinomadura sp. 7K507]TDC78600.1 LacI family transcriptional regulator [Actinomadura sp. 7K507]
MTEGKSGSGRPTIYHVAKEAGVSPSTVSRAMSNPGRVNAATAARVAEVAARLGYRTNTLARALPSGRTDTLALFVSDITNPHFFGVIRGAEHQARAAGCTLIVGDTEESPEVEARNIERLGPSVDGFVIAASRMSDEEITGLSAGHRLILISREVADVPSVIVDHAEGTRQIVEHLASLGHRSIVFLGGPPRSWLGARRWDSLAAAAGQHGISARRIGPFPPTMAGGAAAADAALGTGATAAVAHNDLLAIGVLRRCAERGVSVPGDLSVVGYDDIFGADFCSPPLTTLAGQFEESGRTAVDMLLAMRDRHGVRPPRDRVILPSHLAIRRSTGPAPER